MSGEQSFIERTTKNVVSGTVAGIAVCLVGHPFDTLKVRLQTQSARKPIYSGLTDCFLKTLKWEGIGGLYKGVASPIAGQMFFRATLFSSYYQVSTFIAGSDRAGQRLEVPYYFVCGAVTGFIGSFAECPIDLFKTKLQIQIMRERAGKKPQYQNVFQAGADIARKHGPRGVYQGLSATWIRNVPAFSYYFGFYEWTREALTPKGNRVEDLPGWALFLSGGVAGFLYWFLTYPLDVVKSAIQSDASDPKRRKYKGYMDCARYLYDHEGGGMRFFRGFTPCLLRSVPANATMLFTLEKCRQFLD